MSQQSGDNGAAAAAAAAQIGSSMINAWSAANTNKKQRKWAEMMYGRQLADNQAQWAIQNEYNSPTSQMARLREAGLNPNLVYGKGADNVASAMPSAPSASWNPKAPQVDLGSGLMRYHDIRLRDAQIDNLKVQNTVQTQEALLKAAQTANTVANTSRSQFDLGLASELRQTSLDAARENLRQMKVNTDFQLNEDERRTALNSSSLQEAATRIMQMRENTANTVVEREKIRATIENIKNSNEIQQLDLELRRNGINPNDPLYLRILGRFIGDNVNTSVWDTFRNKISDSWNKTNPFK